MASLRRSSVAWGNRKLPSGEAHPGGSVPRVSPPLAARRDPGDGAPGAAHVDQGGLGDQQEDQRGLEEAAREVTKRR